MTQFFFTLALFLSSISLQAATYPIGLDIAAPINLTHSTAYKESAPLYRVDSINAYLVPVSSQINSDIQPTLLAAPYTIFNPTLYLVLDRSTIAASSPYLNSGFSNLCQIAPSQSSTQNFAGFDSPRFDNTLGNVDSSRPGLMLLPSMLDVYRTNQQIAEADIAPFKTANPNPAVLSDNISCTPGSSNNPLVYGSYAFPSPNFTTGGASGSGFTNSSSSVGDIAITDPPVGAAPPVVPSPEPGTYAILIVLLAICFLIKKRESMKSID